MDGWLVGGCELLFNAVEAHRHEREEIKVQSDSAPKSALGYPSLRSAAWSTAVMTGCPPVPIAPQTLGTTALTVASEARALDSPVRPACWTATRRESRLGVEMQTV